MVLKIKGKIFILQGALYGAKGSANAWYLELGDDLRGRDFMQSTMDKSFWFKQSICEDQYDYLCHHVDDILGGGPNIDNII